MKMERTKNASRSIAWGIVNKTINMILPFISRTVMIYAMGTMYVGLNGLFTSVLQVLNIAELGISSAIVFSMYRPLAEGNENEVCALLNFYKLCYRIIGIIILICGLLLLPFLPKLISGDVPQDINLYILYIMNLGATAFSYYLFSYKSSLLQAIQRNDIISKISTVITMLQITLQILALLIWHNYYIYVLILLCCVIVNNISVHKISKRLFPQYYCKGTITREKLGELKIKVGGMIFQKIGGVVLTSVDTIVISAFLGLNILGIYQNYYYIITSLFGILSVIQNALVATVGNSITLESTDKNYSDFKKFNFIYIWIVSWFSLCLLCLYQPFMQIWVGKERMLSDGMTVLFTCYFFIHKWCDMLFIYQEACGIWWETKWIPLTAAIVNLFINIILVVLIGLPGVLISTILSVIFVYDVGYARILFFIYFEDKGRFKRYLYRQLVYLLSVVCVSVVVIMICKVIQGPLFVQLLLKAVVCIVIPNALFVLMWNRLPEYSEAKNFSLKKFFKLHRYIK